MLKDFDKFMSQLKETNQTLDFFCDFEKISQNVEDIKLSLCMLNSLIGASDLPLIPQHYNLTLFISS